MTDKPRILKKVEELSDAIEVAKEIPKMESADGRSVIFKPDFRVEPPDYRVYSCKCYYGGERMQCDICDTEIFSLRKTISPRRRMFNECNISGYARKFLDEMKKLAEEQK